MSINLGQLASQGRAKSSSQPWATEELEALLLLEKERSLNRLDAADYVRNGILTVEAYDASKEAAFKPKTIEDAKAEVDATLMKGGALFGKAKVVKPKK